MNLVQNTPVIFLPGKTQPFILPLTAGSPYPEQVRIARNQARLNFDTMFAELPRLKPDYRRPNVKGLLGEIFNENSTFGRSAETGRTTS